MTNISITKPQALRALREAVALKGADFTYEMVNRGCVYTENGQPSCIVGHALASLGVPIETLELIDNVDREYTDSDMVSAYEDVLKPNGIRIGPKALEVLREAQEQQDAGLTWGYALEQAEAV